MTSTITADPLSTLEPSGLEVADPRAGQRGGFRRGKHVKPRRGPSYERIRDFPRWAMGFRDHKFRGNWNGALRTAVWCGLVPPEAEPLGMALSDASSARGIGPGGGVPSLTQVELGLRVHRADRTVRTHLANLKKAGLVVWVHNIGVTTDGMLITDPNEYRLTIPDRLWPHYVTKVRRALKADPNRDVKELPDVIAGRAPLPARLNTDGTPGDAGGTASPERARRRRVHPADVDPIDLDRGGDDAAGVARAHELIAIVQRSDRDALLAALRSKNASSQLLATVGERLPLTKGQAGRVLGALDETIVRGLPPPRPSGGSELI